jgi:hypothetical protein
MPVMPEFSRRGFLGAAGAAALSGLGTHSTRTLASDVSPIRTGVAQRICVVMFDGFGSDYVSFTGTRATFQIQVKSRPTWISASFCIALRRATYSADVPIRTRCVSERTNRLPAAIAGVV